jgi:hypothetical protein
MLLLISLPFSEARFIQPDPIVQQVYNPQNLNRYAYVVDNPYKYVDPNGKWAVSVGGEGSYGLGLGAGGGVGIAFGYSGQGGWQFGSYETGGGGAYAGVKGELGGTASFYPDAQNIYELGGTGLDTSAGLYLGVGGSLKASFAPEDESLPFGKKITNFEPTPASYGISVGPGLGGGGSAFITGTTVQRYIGGMSIKDFNAYVSHIDSSIASQQFKTELKTSVANTQKGGNAVTWYYNQKTKTYQYWVGNGKPSNPGYSKITISKK